MREIVLAGVDNANESATLVALDPRDFGGASETRPGSPYRIRGVPPAREKAVLLFERTCLSRALAPYNIARQIMVHGETLDVNVFEVPDEPPRIIYTFDRNLRVLRVLASDAFQNAHRRIEAEGRLGHSLTERELATLHSVRVLRQDY